MAKITLGLWAADILLVPTSTEHYRTWLHETLPAVIGDLVGPASGWELSKPIPIDPFPPRLIRVGIKAIREVPVRSGVWVIEVDVKGVTQVYKPTGKWREERKQEHLLLEETPQVFEIVLSYKLIPRDDSSVEVRMVCRAHQVSEQYYALRDSTIARWPKTQRLSGNGVYIDTSFVGATASVIAKETKLGATQPGDANKQDAKFEHIQQEFTRLPTFRLETSAENFTTWLIERDRTQGFNELVTKDGTDEGQLIFLRGLEVIRQSNSLTIVEQSYSYFMAPDAPQETLFYCRLVQLKADLIEVRFYYNDQMAGRTGFFKGLIQEVMDRYPEADRQLGLKHFYDWLGRPYQQATIPLLPLTDEREDSAAFRGNNGSQPPTRYNTPDKQERRRRGGPAPVPDNEKIEIIKGWHLVRRKRAYSQEEYCRQKGIAPSTLRAWERDLGARGLLGEAAPS